ncbi:hypothetical protein Ade02nite_34400 [Paractinoplanes deccanensis]|uniref:DUF3592 domain-containing protein n=1 Tax=Paractinoplanes deccanensis TaxID=113561 RepID=A0ABQ3Y473_9ACTN|nr:DUF6346 domain-containing protein [Actinoplanes deccanensis]GID74799.1 hypothetical protein Ade02nite_34400 [Actinoplanes deccanensis]
MQPPDDRIAKRLEEIRAREAAADAEPAPADDLGSAVVDRRKGGALRSTVFVIVLIVAAAGLFGLAVTLTRLAGDDFGDAERYGRADVTSCVRHGPITNKGFGYWESCAATITWDGGDTDRATVDAVFTSGDIGSPVRVGDLGTYRTTRELVREDAAYRPWLAWIGYAVGFLAFVPTLVLVLTVREALRRKR